jgi:hypothetical protein
MQLDEKFFDGVLDALDLRLDLRSLADAHGARNHGAGHSTRTAKGCNTQRTT